MRNSENINSRFIRRSRTGTLLLMPDAMETRPVQAKEKSWTRYKTFLP
jgi:hypothetical protein